MLDLYLSLSFEEATATLLDDMLFVAKYAACKTNTTCVIN